MQMDDRNNYPSETQPRNIITNTYLTIHQDTYKLLLINFYERIVKSSWFQKLYGVSFSIIGIGISGIVEWIASALVPYIRDSQFAIFNTLSKLYVYISILSFGAVILLICLAYNTKEKEGRKAAIIDELVSRTLEKSSNIQNQSEFIDVTHDSKEMQLKYIDVDLRNEPEAKKATA
ncbi:MAG: hypothetical protein MRZ54_00305 [Clostridiales bacterium]|nr:hypothetical protein [Clostridiales bacterium]